VKVACARADADRNTPQMWIKIDTQLMGGLHRRDPFLETRLSFRVLKKALPPRA
jgi:hypothetical protein